MPRRVCPGQDGTLHRPAEKVGVLIWNVPHPVLLLIALGANREWAPRAPEPAGVKGELCQLYPGGTACMALTGLSKGAAAQDTAGIPLPHPKGSHIVSLFTFLSTLAFLSTLPKSRVGGAPLVRAGVFLGPVGAQRYGPLSPVVTKVFPVQFPFSPLQCRGRKSSLAATMLMPDNDTPFTRGRAASFCAAASVRLCLARFS